MADAGKAPPRLTVQGLKEVVSDAEELAKGVRLLDDQALSHLARHETRLYAEAKGSGAAPYKVQVTFDEKVKGRCSCMAARSRPFCKHAAGLLVAWARTPEAFAVAEVAPAAPEGPGGAKKRSVKTGATDEGELMGGGVRQAATLVRELALSGVASLGPERAEQIAALATSLREARLRRLSARTLALSEAVALAASGSDAFDAPAYAELFADLVLTVRKLEKHLAGEALEPVYVEELIGKTWTKKDRAPTSGHDLVEYAFTTRVTPDDFVVRESRFVELKAGTHFSEKQILPAFLAKRAEPKKSHAGLLLEGAHGSRYPSFEPVRLELAGESARRPLDDAALGRLLAVALPSVTAALAAFQERRRDVFAPDTLPVAVKVDSILAEGRRLQALDGAGGALFLPDEPSLAEALAAALRGVHLEALLGDVALEGALPSLFPLAAVVRAPAGLRLAPVAARDASEVLASRKVRTSGPVALRGAQRTGWAEVARGSGVSTAAIALGEVRDELAQALVSGLGSLVPRLTEPLAARLKDLGLAKQADLLGAAATRSDPADRLDDFVKLYQVLGIALTRLSGATHVDRASLTTVPTFESVRVASSAERLEPRRIAEQVAQGRLNRYQAAVRYAAWYDGVPVETLAESLYPTWADGSAQPYVARVFASRGDQAVAAASAALGLDAPAHADRWRRPAARMVRLTALKVLEAVGGEAAARALGRFEGQVTDKALKALTRRALGAVDARLGQGPGGLGAPERDALARHTGALLDAGTKDARAAAAAALAQGGFVEAIPHLRASFLGDVATDVREAAALALGELGDAESVDAFVALVARRAEDHQGAKLGAYALARLGDIRGIDALLEAWAEGWQPAIVSEALRQIGLAALDPLVDRIEQQPELIKRRAALGALEGLPPAEVAEALLARARRRADEPDFATRALLWAQLAAVNEACAKAFAAGVLAARPGLGEKGATKEERALLRKLRAAAEP
jgi:HEAT repeat protein